MIYYMLAISVGRIEGLGKLGVEDDGNSISIVESASTFAKLLTVTIGLITAIAFIWFVVKLFIGAIGMMSSGGDKTKVAEAKESITQALIGLIIVFSAIFIAKLIEFAFGTSILDISQTIIDLKPSL